jgi:hypothetical protein
MVDIRLPLPLANRLASYLDNLRADHLADQAGGAVQFSAEHQAVMRAVMAGVGQGRRDEARVLLGLENPSTDNPDLVGQEAFSRR